MTQSRRTWQRHEQRVAEALGTQRKRAGESGADVVTSNWAIECKSFRALPARVLAALQQAERSAGRGRVAVAVLHQVGARRDSDLVVMRWRDFAALHLGNHEDDRRISEVMADATDDERAILTPDIMSDTTI